MHVVISEIITFCVITLCVRKVITICVERLLHFALKILLHFALVLHFAAILITFCTNITFCGDYYILRRNTTHSTILKKALKKRHTMTSETFSFNHQRTGRGNWGGKTDVPFGQRHSKKYFII